MANTLQLVLSVDNRAGNQAIGQFNNNLGGIENAAIRASQGASRALQGIDQTAVRVAASVRSSFSGLGAALGVTGIAALAKSTFDLVAGFERSRIGLKAFLGDAQKADALFKEIQTFAEKSPFEFKDLLTGSQRLLAFKTEAKDIVPTLKAISATIGATGGDQGSFDSLIKAIGDIRNRGKVTGEEIRQLTNQGVPAVRLLAEGFGKTTAEISKAVSDGIVPADAAIRVLVRGMTSEFGKFDDEVGKTASVAVSNFKDTVQRLADDVAKDYLPSITKGINDLRAKLGEFAGWIRENKGTIASVGDAIAGIAVAIVSFKVVQQIEAVVVAARAASLALASTPWGLIAAGIGFVAFETYKTNAAFQELQKQKVDDSIVQGLLKNGKTVKDLEALGFTAERVKAALGRPLDEGSGFGGAAKGLREQFGITIVGEAAAKAAPKIEQFDTGLRDAEEAATRAANANKRSAEILEKAQRGELTGLARIIEEYRQYNAELGITSKSRADLAKAQLLDLGAEVSKERLKALESEKKTAEIVTKGRLEMGQILQADEDERTKQSRGLFAEAQRERISIQEAGLSASRDRELQGLEAINAVTVDQKIGIENRKSEIESGYLQASSELKKQILELDYAREAALAEGNAVAMLAIDQKYGLLRTGIENANQAAIDAAKQSAAIRSNQLIIAENQRTFDQYKTDASNAIDAAIGVFQNGWKSMGNFLKATLLGAFKEVLSDKIARAVFGALGGDTSALATPNRGGGLFGKLLGLGAAVPALGAAGAPGGTPGFAGPVTSSGGINPLGAATQLGGGSGGAAGAASLAPLLGIGGGLLGGLGAFKLGQSNSKIGKSLAIPTGVAAGLLGFGGLVSLFPALLAAGPAGWIAAGAIGGFVGLMGLLRTKAEDKIVKAVKRVYGFELEKKFAKDTLLPIIKSQFGGDIEAGLRSPQIRELLELYAMSRGLNSQGVVTRATPSVFASRGGAFAQVPTFQNGSTVIAGSSQNNSTAGPTVIQLDAEATTQLLQGQAVQAMAANPRVVSRVNDAGSSQRGSRASGGNFVFA